MALDYKKVIFTVCLSSLIVVICCVYAYKQSKQPSHDTVIGPGQFADPSLKFAAVLFRHGNRAPEISYKTDPYGDYFPEGKGELTKQGKQNMYKKGQIFRLLYNGFLSDLYLNSEILIQTTNMRRTFMSAALVLAGMYPPKEYQKWSDKETVWQPIPIYQNSPDHGSIFNEDCLSFDAVSKTVLNYNSNSNLTEPLLLYLSNKCGQPITKRNLIKLYDLFVCQISAGLQLPEWITPEKFQTLKSIVLNKEDSVRFFGNPKLQKLIIGPLLKEIALAMEFHTNNSNNYNNPRKMHLYSGHDISIATTMAFLANIYEMPDYGASLHFHLYHNETIGHIVKIFFYDRWNTEKGKELSLHICGNPCKIQDFVNIMKYNFSKEWKEECQITDN